MKNKKLLGFILGFCLSLSMFVPVFAGNTEQYTIQKNDTLWKISRSYKISLNPIIKCNPQVKNPNLIYPGEELRIPIDGKTNLTGIIGSATTSNPNHEYTSNFGESKDIKSVAQSVPIEQKVADIVNKSRLEAGIKPLPYNKYLSNVARIKSQEMRDKKYFDHNSPTYGDPFSMLNSFGITYKSAGENIAKGQKTANDVMNAWMNSEGHKKNILSPNFKEIGVGYAIDSSGITYWTQEFIS